MLAKKIEMHPEELNLQQDSNMQALITSVIKLKSVKINLWNSLLDCLSRGRNKRRRQKAVMDLTNRYSQQLDVRRIISNSIAFQDFIRCFLLRPQKALLFHQRTRISLLNSQDSQISDSFEDEGGNPLGNFNSANFKKDLQNFKPQSLLDKKLLLGVLFDNGIVPKHDKRKQQRSN